MADLVLQASDDLVARIAHESDPVRALVELIWNAIDGEARIVRVELEREITAAISVVRVVDDGHGISSDEVEATFGRIGGSWKQRGERRSKAGLRQLHGRFGQGRLRAFALGSRVVWSSRSDNTVGQRQEVTITASRSNRERFRWDVVPSAASSTGTTVTAHNDEQRPLAPLEADSAIPTLLSYFAPVLLNDKSLTITFDGAALDPRQDITLDTQIPVRFGDGDTRDTLTRLLSETTLSAIIRSANLVASRHKFLAGLEHLLFDPDQQSDVGERDHLHKILEQELWIFGEGYHLMSSERGLTELLRNHLKLAGLPDKGVTPVKRWDGKSGRTDLHLAARHKEHDRIRHLVVELKAPNLDAGRREIDQVEDYANAILANPAFTSDKATWDFILVVTDYDDVVRRRIIGEDRAVGLYLAPKKEPDRPLVRAHVRRWRDIIDENKRRLDFITSALEHDPSIMEGLEYVRQEYRDLLPAPLIEGTAAAAKAMA